MSAAPTPYVHYGCGFCAPTAWANFDSSPSLRIQKTPLIGSIFSTGAGRFPSNVAYGDIVRGLPVADGSCHGVYCSHILEHLALGDLRAALINTRRMLVASGIFRLVVPDLRAAALRYVEDKSDHAAVRFMTETSLGLAERHRGPGALIRAWLGNSRHLWMWDFQSLRREIEDAGFAAVRPAEVGDSGNPMFDFVEEKSRWQDSVGIECHA